MSLRRRVGLCCLLQLTQLLMASSSEPADTASKPPHVVFIVADDLGWNDVSFHGSPQIPTPSIDALAKSGVILDRHYVQPVCSPTRSTILSGRHVIHTGIYMPFSQGTALRLNLTYSLLPEYMQRVGYSSHMVGKWHLGQNVLKALPTGRGFESYLGYWSGAEDYFTHEVKNGYDFADNTTTAVQYKGQYSCNVFTQRAVDIIKTFSDESTKPLFLYLAYQNVHWPLEAPQAYIDKFKNINDTKRRSVAAMASIMDEAIGNVTNALKQAGIFDDTLIVFTADNGGPTNNDENTMSNNYPLRGGKNTIWEGGTRVSALISGKGIQSPGRVYSGLVHASDWLPTLVSMSSGQDWHNFIAKDEPPYLDGDGIDVWQGLSTGQASARDWILYEAHGTNASDQVHGNALRVGDMKIVQIGMNPEPGWYPPPGQDPSQVHYTVDCGGPQPSHADPHACKDFCLFNVTADPCEYHDLAAQHPDIVETLKKRLSSFQAAAVPPVSPEGCEPVINKQGAWRPCDAP